MNNIHDTDLHGRPATGKEETPSRSERDTEGYSPDTEEGKGQGAKAALGTHYHIHTAEDIYRAKDEPPPAIIEGVLPEMELMLRSGRAKSGKSWDALQLDIGMAKGGECWHLRELKRHQTVYVNLELKETTLMFRIKRIAEAMGIKDIREMEKWFTPITIDCGGLMLDVAKIDPDSDGAYTRALLAQIETAIDERKIQPGFVTIDSWYKIVGKYNENDAGDVTACYRHIRNFIKRCGCAVDVIHHFTKGAPGEKMSGDRAAGSRVHQQEPSTVLEMIPLKADDAYTIHIEQRDYARVKDYGVKWNFPLFDVDYDLDTTDYKGPASKPGTKPKTGIKSFCLLLKMEPLHQGEWRTVAKESLGISRTNFYNYFTAAKKSGMVTQQGELWYYVDENTPKSE